MFNFPDHEPTNSVVGCTYARTAKDTSNKNRVIIDFLFIVRFKKKFLQMYKDYAIRFPEKD